MSSPSMSPRSLTILLACLSMVGPFSIDTYLPSFPAMAASLQVDPVLVQQTLSAYLFAFATMMLFHGTLADTFGRRALVLTALTVYTAASVGAAMAETLHSLLIFRALQGASAGAGIVAGRAIVRDLSSGAEAQRRLAHITMVFGIAPAIAPILGGWLHSWWGWRAVFVFLATWGALLWLCCYFRLAETLPRESRQPMHLPTIVRNYIAALRNPQFLFLAASVGLAFSGFGLYIAAAPDFLIHVLGLPETAFAWLFLPLVAGQVAGAWTSARMAHFAAPGVMVMRGFTMMAIGASINLLYNLLAPAPQLPWVVLPLPFYTLGVAMLVPSITLRVLDLFPHTRGLAASLQAFVQTLIFALTAALAPLAFGSSLKLAAGLALAVLASLACYAVACRLRARQRGLAAEQ
jgi:MFS transporter, DHA1 family, multidrug resistance protein